MQNQTKGKLGEEYVRNYLIQNGYQLVEERRNGCDLVVSKDGATSAIEVKTTGNMSGGIPDMHDTEFILRNDQWFFVADFLYVVRVDAEDKPFELNILSKEEIDRYADSHMTVTRIRTTKLDRDLNKGLVGKTIRL